MTSPATSLEHERGYDNPPLKKTWAIPQDAKPASTVGVRKQSWNLQNRHKSPKLLNKDSWPGGTKINLHQSDWKATAWSKKGSAHDSNQWNTWSAEEKPEGRTPLISLTDHSDIEYMFCIVNICTLTGHFLQMRSQDLYLKNVQWVYVDINNRNWSYAHMSSEYSKHKWTALPFQYFWRGLTMHVHACGRACTDLYLYFNLSHTFWLALTQEIYKKYVCQESDVC